MEYSIEVDVLVSRTYRAEADCPGDALVIYRAGDAEMEEDDTSNSDERDRTARVITQGGIGAWVSVPPCEHNGDPCDGARFCKLCRIQIFSGFLYGDEEYCNDHKPKGWDSEMAAMRHEEFDSQDEMCWTQWELEDIDCDCPTDCQCRPSPEALQVLYDTDRARSDAESKAINSWVGEVPQSKDGTSHWNVTHNPDGTVTATPEDIFPCSNCGEERPVSELIDLRCHPCINDNPENKEMMHCELCGDIRLEEDLNEDQRCPPCEEREERNEHGLGGA